MRTLLTVLACCVTMAATSAFTTTSGQSDLDQLLKRMNTELPVENGCDKAIYSFSNCTLNISLACSGKEFSIDINMNDLQRVYKDTGDIGDEFETVFFTCGRGSTCIKSQGGLPDQPVFPVKLPKDPDSDLGEKMLEVFGNMVGNCGS